MDTQEKKAFKDWWDEGAANALADQMVAAMSAFDRERFMVLATDGLKHLEMSDRIKQFSNALRATLPETIPEALVALLKSLPPAMADCESVSDGWLQWPLGQFILDYGVDHFEESMTAMRELTQRFSAEFAVRPFAERYPEKTMSRLLALTSDSSPHVRRWCSEGIRPRLPWGRKLRGLVDDPTPIWPILEELKDDEELYVRRSVANNLNDIAKDHPELVIACCQRWTKLKSIPVDWVIKHGLRTLIKDGNPDALSLVGFEPPRQLEASLRTSETSVAIGDPIGLSARLENGSSRPQKIMVDYVVHYVRKGGKSSQKVFKWKSLELPAKDSVELAKSHSMRVTTVRALYAGIHKVELQVNGKRIAEASFRLVE